MIKPEYSPIERTPIERTSEDYLIAIPQADTDQQGIVKIEEYSLKQFLQETKRTNESYVEVEACSGKLAYRVEHFHPEEDVIKLLPLKLQKAYLMVDKIYNSINPQYCEDQIGLLDYFVIYLLSVLAPLSQIAQQAFIDKMIKVVEKYFNEGQACTLSLLPIREIGDERIPLELMRKNREKIDEIKTLIQKNLENLKTEENPQVRSGVYSVLESLKRELDSTVEEFTKAYTDFLALKIKISSLQVFVIEKETKKELIDEAKERKLQLDMIHETRDNLVLQILPILMEEYRNKIENIEREIGQKLQELKLAYAFAEADIIEEVGQLKENLNKLWSNWSQMCEEFLHLQFATTITNPRLLPENHILLPVEELMKELKKENEEQFIKECDDLIQEIQKKKRTKERQSTGPSVNTIVDVHSLSPIVDENLNLEILQQKLGEQVKETEQKQQTERENEEEIQKKTTKEREEDFLSVEVQHRGRRRKIK